MSAQQLCFFKFERPLLQLFGIDFFRQAPAGPGVYLFRGDAGRVLYVGQSRNLRLRLSYYKNAQPEREPRRIIRLVHQTRAIELQCCESAAAAQAREIQLIRELRPRFNVQHARPPILSFFAISEERIRLALEEKLEPGEVVLGPFKYRTLCRQTLFSAARTIWSTGRQLRSVFEFPITLMSNFRVHELQIALDPSIREELIRFLRGDSLDFAARTEALAKKEVDPFLKKMFEQDYSTLLDFFSGISNAGLPEDPASSTSAARSDS